LLLAIVHDLNVVRAILAPDKTESPLVVDPNAVRPLSVAAQRF
jgi:hypothetical protein